MPKMEAMYVYCSIRPTAPKFNPEKDKVFRFCPWCGSKLASGDRNPSILVEEYKYYQEIKDELLLSNKGQFVVIKNREKLGCYSSMSLAYAVGLDKYGNVPFLIQEIVPVVELWKN